ncbi:MAG: hypothetical protein EPN38_12630 [Rhodanobacteraceae bacterium]|nr:MAG: hypothetical protein EPN38_12630 [Rhodanobacteraceae bacterium]
MRTARIHRLRLAGSCALALAIAPGLLAAAPATRSPATPQSWPMYALAPGHNAWHASDFPALSWRYAVPGAAEANASRLLNRTMIRDLVGFAVGVAVVDGTVYATNDDGYLYAVDARTGKLRWRFHAFNQLMGTPIVATVDGRRLVFVGAGNSVFAYSHAVNFAKPGARVIRGNGLSAMFAVDAATGKQVWVYPTQGEDMPTPVFDRGRLLFGNGDGHVYALAAASGQLVWKTPIKSFVSMSSATLDPGRGVLVMGGTQPSAIHGLDAETGKLLWSVTPPGVFSSSAGDGTLAIHGSTAIGQIETQDDAQARSGESSSQELAIDLGSGKILWSTTLGGGKVPPRNKDAVPTIVAGVVYTGSPVTHREYALDAASGKILWQRAMPASMKAAPAVVGNAVIQPTASGDIVTLDKGSGKIIHTYNGHQGGYGPQNAVVVGRTLFIGTNAGTLQAIPLEKLAVRP